MYVRSVIVVRSLGNKIIFDLIGRWGRLMGEKIYWGCIWSLFLDI